MRCYAFIFAACMVFVANGSFAQVAKAPSPATAQATAPSLNGMNLNIVLSCPITVGDGNETCSDRKTTIPQYHGIAPGSCPAVEGALRHQQVDMAAGLAQFVSANLALPAGYTLTPIGNSLAISSSAGGHGAAAKSDPTPLIKEIVAYLTLLNSSRDVLPPMTMKLTFPMAALLGGNASTALVNAGSSNFQVQALTNTSVLVSPNPAGAIRTCQQWTDFFSQAGEIARTVMQAPPIYRTYQIDAGDAATALNATPLVAQGGGSGDNKGGTGSAAGGGAPNPGGSGGAGGGGAAAGNGSGNANQGPGKGAGGGAGAPTGGPDNSNSGRGSGAPPTPPSAPAPSTATASAFPTGHPGDDLILLAGANGDSAIPEKERILAAMDLPRPQMLINGWVLQSSTKDYSKSAQFRNAVTQFVNQQNDALQAAVLTGWNVIAGRIKAGMAAGPINLQSEQLLSTSSFFDHDFTDYLTQRKAYNPVKEGPSPSSGLTLAGEESGATAAQPSQLFCQEQQYCMGYTELFAHVRPRLTDLLLTLIAANDPPAEVNAAIDAVEGNPSRGQTGTPCENRDLDLLKAGGDTPPLALECLRERADTLLAPGHESLGTVRAALADFLFNYKMSQMYPHEFTPYDLSQSAVAFDHALEPLIDNFNRDIAAFQIYWQGRITDQESHLISEKQLFYSGILSVRTVAGNASTASTTSQSYLNISQAPDIGTLLSNLAAAAPAAVTAGTPAGVLAGNMSPNEVQSLKAALQSYQTTKAQIGRQLTIQAQPRSLAGASAAEMDVTFNASESAPPTYWSTAPASNTSGPDLSRVASQSVTTHVRVDSLNLFEISSMTAILRAGRTKFPLLPPFVEIPYIGTLVGIPLKQAENFQTSTAIISAVVVPTASDLANGLRFRADLVLLSLNDGAGDQSCKLGGAVPTCHVRQAASMQELGGRARLIEYNHQMVQCYASGATDCYSLRLDQILAPRP